MPVLSGFLILGILLGLPGSLLIAWQYHIDVEPRLIGLHFLGLNIGFASAAVLARRYIRRVPAQKTAALSCALAVLALLALSFLPPPAWPGWRIAFLGLLGAAAGSLSTALFYLSELSFKNSPSLAANTGALLFGCGCLIATILTGATYFAGSVRLETLTLALLPLLFLLLYLRGGNAGSRFRPLEQPSATRDSVKDLRSVATLLFSLVLFFQFGNECALAGWLPLFLVHRLGTNPAWAVGGLAIYFVALMMGRLAARLWLPRLNQRRTLIASIALSMAGYLMLSFATLLQAAILAVVFIALGYASIYPLIAEQSDDRFSYHPGLYSGALALAVVGGTFAPWLLGYVDAYFGIRAILLLPTLGSCAVLLLSLLIMFEARLMSGKKRKTNQGPLITSDRM